MVSHDVASVISLALIGGGGLPMAPQAGSFQSMNGGGSFDGGGSGSFDRQFSGGNNTPWGGMGESIGSMGSMQDSG
jgi:hypothetical protein